MNYNNNFQNNRSMNVAINVIKKDKVFLFLPVRDVEKGKLQEYYERIRNYIALQFPQKPYSFAIGEDNPFAVFIIIDANNDLEDVQKYRSI